MNRLTKRDKQGRWSLLDFSWHELHSGAVLSVRLVEALYGALCKLKDYEDTGMSPEDVRELNDFEQSQVGKMLKKLNEEQRRHRWIPVEERLPEVGEHVLVSFISDGLLPAVAIISENWTDGLCCKERKVSMMLRSTSLPGNLFQSHIGQI